MTYRHKPVNSRSAYSANTKHFYNICTTLAQRLPHWSSIGGDGDLDKFVVSEPLRFATRIRSGERGAWGH